MTIFFIKRYKKNFSINLSHAFEAMSAIVEDPGLCCSFVIEPGQLQVVNNRSFGHGRTEYEDPEDKTLRRRLLRLWHRDWGRRSYCG